jgi:hypothetical protein
MENHVLIVAKEIAKTYGEKWKTSQEKKQLEFVGIKAQNIFNFNITLRFRLVTL